MLISCQCVATDINKNKQVTSNFQVKHPHCVDGITSRVKCSQTQLLVFILLRDVYIACILHSLLHNKKVYNLMMDIIQAETKTSYVNTD